MNVTWIYIGQQVTRDSVYKKVNHFNFSPKWVFYKIVILFLDFPLLNLGCHKKRKEGNWKISWLGPAEFQLYKYWNALYSCFTQK